MILTGVALIFPFKYLRTKAYWRNLLSLRWEMYAVRDGAYYNHFRANAKGAKAENYRNAYFMWKKMPKEKKILK